MGASGRPPFEWAAVQSFFDSPPFASAAVREMLLATGAGALPNPQALDAVACALNNLARSFAFDRWQEVAPSIADDQARTTRLAHLCAEALATVGIAAGGVAPDNVLPSMGRGGLFGAAAMRGEPNGEAAIMNALQAVDLLRQDAAALGKVLARRRALHPTKKGNTEKRAVKRLVAGLAHIYFMAWEREPSVTRGAAGETQGPFVALMCHVAGVIHSRLGAAGIRPNAEALAKTWERLPADEKGKWSLLTK